MQLVQPPISASDLPPTAVPPGITRAAAAEASEAGPMRRMCSIGSPISLDSEIELRGGVDRGIDKQRINVGW